MINNIGRKFALLLPLAGTLLLTGCGGEKISINVKNLTGAEISEIQICPESDKSGITNRLEENLPADGETTLSLGRLTEEETANGFYLIVTNAEDGSEGEFSMLMLSDGDTVSFYVDDWGLAVGVNMTDAEIEEQKARDHQDYLEMEAEERAAEEAEAAEE